MLTLLFTLIATSAASDDVCGRIDDLLEADLPCATAAMHYAIHECGPDALAPLGLGPYVVLEDYPRPRADKTTREAVGFFGNEYETENFVIKWNNYSGFNNNDIQVLGSAFERAWDVEVVQMGYPMPIASDVYKFNVYIGDTGGDAPSSNGAAGWMNNDSEGYPMIVMAASGVSRRSQAQLTAAHELFHAIQFAVGTYQYTGQGAWYYESTAVWIENEVYPTNSGYAWFLYYFAILPELPVNFFEYPQDGNIEEYHQYGAFIFIKHLSDHYGGPDLIQRSFFEATSGGDPLDVLDGILQEDGVRIEDAFFDFTVRNATFDYPQEEWYEAVIDASGGWSGSYSHRPSGSTWGATEDWVVASNDLPHTYGANYWRLASLPEHFELTIDGYAGPREWHAALVSQTGDVHRVDPIDMSSGVGILELDDDTLPIETWLVVSAVTNYRDSGTEYPYTFRIDDLDPIELPDTEEETAKACGCESSSTVPWWMALLPLISLRRSTGSRPSRSS